MTPFGLGPTPGERAMEELRRRVGKFGADMGEMDRHIEQAESIVQTLLAAGLTFARPLNEKTVRAALAAVAQQLAIARVHSADAAFRSLRWDVDDATDLL